MDTREIRTNSTSIIHPSQYRMLEPDNPFYPLPKDYPTLSVDAQKEARLATLRKQDTPMEQVAAWDLFRRLYLMPTEPGFFYHHFSPSPPFHYEAVYDLGNYGRNVLAAPRGTAKSVVLGTEIPLFLLLTRPYYRLILSLATDKLIESRFDTIINQLVNNPFILADFGPSKPKRGSGIWNRHHIQLLNGSKCEGFSVTGRKRGARPDLFILDDPEFDPESEFTADTLREKFEVFLFKQVIPMLEHGSGIYWVGTMINRRTYLWHACNSDDPRFKFWNRKVLQAIQKDEKNDKVSVLWEGKWSQEILDMRKEEIGAAAFASEYLNSPTSEGERTLKIDATKTEYHINEFDGNTPLTSLSEVFYYKQDRSTMEWVEEKKTQKDLFNEMYRIITFDPAKGLSQHHDYSAIAVLGFDRSNTMWVLDMWMGRAKETQLLYKLYELGSRWKVRVVGIESISKQKEVVDAATSYLKERAMGGWMPRVVGVDYRNVAGPRGKSSRISTLEWRFDSGKIKYPSHLKDIWPYSALYAQTRDFTYDMALLPFDDAIDVVAQGNYVIHSRGSTKPDEKKEQTLADKINMGKVKEGGVPILSGLDSSQMTPDIIKALLDRSTKVRYNGCNQYAKYDLKRGKKPFLGKPIRRPR